MSWSVIYSAHARQDLRNIYEYIAYHLLVPDTASAQTARIMKAIRTLSDFPLRHQICENEPWREQGLRFFPIDRYLIFYLPDEATSSVTIVRILYGGRDIDKQLTENDSLID